MTTTVAVQRAVMKSQLPAPARQIVLTLCVRADFKTAAIPDEHTPSLTDICNETGLGRSTVARCLNQLEKCGWVDRDRPEVVKARTEGARTRYQLMIGSSPTAGLVPERDQPDQEDTDTTASDPSPTQGLGLVPERDQASPTAGLLVRKTPTGSTDSPTSRTSQSQPARAKARGSRIPDDFSVTPAMVAWARERCPNVDGRLETEKFVNYWQSKAGRDATKLDWTATWRNWMLNAKPTYGARASPGRPPDLREHHGLMLNDRTIARLEDNARFAAMDAAEAAHRPAIEGTAS